MSGAMTERPGSAAPETLRLRVSGMHCASCVSRVEAAMAGVPGVRSARVNLATQRAEADLAPGGEGADVLGTRLAAAIRAAGYDAYPVASAVADDREQREREREERAVRRRFALAASLGSVVFVLAHVEML